MNAQDTAFHSPINLDDARHSRRVRAGRVAPDFTFAEPVKKARPITMPETADQITERLMQSLRATEPVASTWQRVAIWVGVPVACFGVAALVFML
ncbi:hypothetical protein [Variovorax sp. PAMC 28711]|uniref:hypothetical protein n=1 Tax=Variovorax sp. PAMC 28711 TaxID=1795631 RepID=UPI00078D4FF9|nr:hypothetical protein [Variovorax sp. PAMC 28711]AMM23021.1 hypothetical protein AX767_00455 [Variovorax sp. PAMC 28711]